MRAPCRASVKGRVCCQRVDVELIKVIKTFYLSSLQFFFIYQIEIFITL